MKLSKIVLAATTITLGAAAYTRLVRPWLLNWGAFDDEKVRPLPGDHIVPNPQSITTRGITIYAGVEQVWPWLAQLGQGRGGFYSFD